MLFTVYFSFLVWRRFDLTLLAGGGKTLGGSGELCCPLTPEQPALLCFFYIVFPHLSMTMLIGNSLTVSSNVEKGISTSHASSHILMWQHFSERFLFSFLI